VKISARRQAYNIYGENTNRAYQLSIWRSAAACGGGGGGEENGANLAAWRAAAWTVPSANDGSAKPVGRRAESYNRGITLIRRHEGVKAAITAGGGRRAWRVNMRLVNKRSGR